MLCPQRYGFYAKHSAGLAALNLVDYLTYKLDWYHPINLYIDLSKVFDNFIHTILLNKLRNYGVNGVAKNFLQSYLSHRHQVVDFNGCTSDTLENKTGVPQGSEIVAFSFLVYINYSYILAITNL